MKELDFYVILYTDKNGNQISKPFDDDENGTLTPIAIVNVYAK